MPFFTIKGKVEVGRQLGRKIGFPTINIKVPKTVKKNQWGVYFSLCKIGSGIYPGLTHLGPSKNLSSNRVICETHLLTLKENLYHQVVEKKLLFCYREIKNFSHFNQLKKQLKRDRKIARKYFGL